MYCVEVRVPQIRVTHTGNAEISSKLMTKGVEERHSRLNSPQPRHRDVNICKVSNTMSCIRKVDNNLATRAEGAQKKKWFGRWCSRLQK